MKGKLKLYLKGVYITSEVIYLPDNELFQPGDDPNLVFERNCKRREKALNRISVAFRVKHMMAILKMDCDYWVELKIESRLNVMGEDGG